MRALASSNRREFKRFIKFAAVGAAGSVTDIALLNILFQRFGFPLAPANTVSFTAAVIQNFTLNRLWTFPESRTRKASSQLVQFAIVSIVGLTINQIVFLAIHSFLKSFWISWVGSAGLGNTVSYNFAKLLAIGVVLFWNFFANRTWTYRGIDA